MKSALIYYLPSLVFSHWGKTLESLEIALRECNLRSLKIDGSLTLEKRGAVLLQFKMEPDIKILLLTYASGSTG
jgi:SNF2 family DNA or RNA helicase